MSSKLEGNSTVKRRVVTFKPGPTIAVATVIVVAIAALLMSVFSGRAVADSASETLATPESFAAINDTAARSAALFTEAGKVLTHPRCVNCHPASDRPRQGDTSRLHQPPVERGADGFGLPAMRCPICHQQTNFEPAGVPGDPVWHLAPRDMAWEGKTLGRFARRSRIRRATAAARWTRSCIMSATITWSVGPGRPAAIVTPRRARKCRQVHCSTPG